MTVLIQTEPRHKYIILQRKSGRNRTTEKNGPNGKKTEMRTKSKGFALILLILMMLVIPLAGVSAHPHPPSDEEFIQEAIDYMLSHHPELEAVDSNNWEFTLIGFTTSRFKLKLTHADGPEIPPTYDLEWIGVITWNKWSNNTHVTEVYYRYQVELTVEKVGPGTTDPGSGTYHVTGGDSYSFSAAEAKSDDPEKYYFKFVKWTIWDGETLTESYNNVLSGTASTDLTITAIFETRYISSCNIVYEDGLNAGYMWRDDHVLLAIKTKGSKSITVTIMSDYGLYTRTFHTNVKSLCIYFKPYWFVGDYSVIVTGTSDLGTDTLSYMLAGLD